MVQLYRPFLSGVYSVSAGLFRFGQGLPWREDGAGESHVFAFGNDYERVMASKVNSHRRALHEYAGEAGLTPELRAQIITFTAQTLARDSGGFISWDGFVLRNTQLGWAARLEPRWGGVEVVERCSAPLAHLVAEVHPIGALDFLGLNVPEDLAVVARNASRDWLAAVHVLSPQHWNPLDKLGRDFVAVHEPVAGSEPMNRTAPRLVEAVISRGPFVRFAWGVSMGDRLDHHPNAPADQDRGEATRFDPDGAFLRVERQTLSGFPDAGGALFTIRPFTYPLREAVGGSGYARQLAAALRSMTPAQVQYKGLSVIGADLLTWLDQQA
ncbi:heme-dependent oxidative N-demethylase subunit alpha family protein [Deinococcus cavernae]|nr:heme-dependent oxidative N-demethylase subunit alpha family protein [Deinococcus cavernae]